MNRHSDETWTLRLARPGDADALPAIERSAGKMFASLPDFAWVADHEPIPAETHRRHIARGHCLVACAGDAPVGFLASEPFGRELHIREMSVVPEWQGRGIGAALVRACMIDARNAGFLALTLTTFREVPWNAPFYRRLGFADVDPASHDRLAQVLADETEGGFSPESRVAMTLALG